ncbi:MAG: hypothetical protein ABSG14_09185 [Verrucomicrobiia bacterium]|jgi:hypothetical protein
MSVLQNGVDDGTGMNQTPGSSYAIFPTALQKIAQMQVRDKQIAFPGLVKDGTTNGAHQFPIQHILNWVEIRADGDAPSGNPLTVQIVIGGVVQSQVFSLNAGSQYSSLIAVTSPGLSVNANTTVAVKLVSGNQASDVVVTLHYQKVIL